MAYLADKLYLPKNVIFYFSSQQENLLNGLLFL